MRHSWHIPPPPKRNGVTFGESRAKADVLNDQLCDVFTRDDLNDLPTLVEGTLPAKIVCTSYY